MGYTIELSSINKDKFDKLMTPIIFCISEDQMALYIKEYNAVNINELLSKILFEYESDKRSLFITDGFNKIIDSMREPILLKDCEILFDPAFQIDVLRLLIMANRRKRTAMLWCGKYKNGKLVFAEPEYKDYKSYNINAYDISCII